MDSNERTPRGSGRWLRILGPVLAAGWLAGAGAASADWLVTVDGELIETRGPWRIEGTRVVFDAANGSLTAVRLSSIDLDATAAYEAELEAAATPKAPPRPAEPVLVLTDRDVPRVRTIEPPLAETSTETSDAATAPGSAVTAEAAEAAATSATTETTDPAAAAAGAPAASGAPVVPAEPSAGGAERGDLAGVVVTSWQEREGPSGLRFIGTLANESQNFATQLRVQAALYDEAGRLIETKSVRLARSSISPGRSTTFEVDFPGIYAFREVRFTPGGRALTGREETAPSTPAPAQPPPR
jgi:hypothetical protein